MDSLSSLRVADLRLILTGAALPAPARTTKADLLARIRASDTALRHARACHPQLFPPPEPSPPPASDPVPAPVPVAAPDPLPSPTLVQTDPELERRKQRADRFGIPLQEADPELDRRKRRAERFGIPLVPVRGAAREQNAGKLRARAERFGGVGGGQKRGAEAVDGAEQERRKRRAERFGLA